MIGFLLTNWRSVLAVAATVVVCYGLHWISATLTEINHETQLTELRTTMMKNCHDAQQRTAEADNAYQKKIADLNSRLAAAKRLHNGTCVRATLGVPSGQLDAKGADGQRRTADIDAGWLLDQAGQCDAAGERLNALIDFFCREYKVHGTDLPGCVR